MSYPILLELRGKLVVIVGGGGVAARKVRGLRDGGADRVRVAAPQVDPSIAAAGVEIVAEEYQPNHLDGAWLVFAATDSPLVNARVVTDARAIGAWVNRADDHGESESDFSTPAVHRDGDVVIAAGAGGNPAIATRIRDAAAASVPAIWVRMARAMAELRPIVRAHGDLAQLRRRELLLWLASDEAMQLLETSGEQAVKAELDRRLQTPSLHRFPGVPREGA